jgi:hypothetical protein
MTSDKAERGRPPRTSCAAAWALGQRVTIAIEPDESDDWIAKARKFARPKVIAEGWTDADIDRLIKDERKAVQHQPG